MNVDEFPTLVSANFRLHDIHGGQSNEASCAGALKLLWQHEKSEGELKEQA
jgi:hypothetical protein